MANTASAAKRARQTKRRTLRNRSVQTGLKTHAKHFRSSVAPVAGTTLDKDAVRKNYEALVSELDSAAKRGVIHKNLANRRKSRLARKLATLA
jgi:small subunit ribosomal protein S20